jgi:RNA polymerase sigma factor (sigma-70 family)
MPGGQELLAHVQAGETIAFTAFVERHRPSVYRWAVGLVDDRDDADDIAQEVFVIVFRKLGAFRGEGSLDGWMYRITRRVAERLRRKTRRRGLLGALPAARPTAEVYTTDPGARVDRERALAMIHQSVSTLPPRQRAVFDLCDLQGHSPSEAADILGLRSVSVRANLFKARASVRRHILLVHPQYSGLRR